MIEKGSVITKDNGIKTLAKIASANTEYGEAIMTYLMEQLRSCRSKSVAQYAESIRIAVKSDNQEQYTSILNERANGYFTCRAFFVPNATFARTKYWYNAPLTLAGSMVKCMCG